MSYLTFNCTSITESFFGNGFELLTEEAQENKVKEKLDDAVKDAANKPKGWIANKIYSFRQLYKSYLDKANREHDSGKIGFFKNIARMILSCIDKLAKFLQNATASSSSSSDDKEKDKLKKDHIEKLDKTLNNLNNQTNNLKSVEKGMNQWKEHGPEHKDENGKDAVDHMRDFIKKSTGKIELKPGEWKNHILHTKDGKKYLDPKYMAARSDFVDVMDHVDIVGM